MIADKDNELNKDLIEDEEGVSDPYERRERGRGRKRKKKRRRKRRSKKRSIPICGVIKLRYGTDLSSIFAFETPESLLSGF